MRVHVNQSDADMRHLPSVSGKHGFTDASRLEQAEAQKHCVAHAAPDRAGNVLRRPDFLDQHRRDADDNHNQERLEAQRQKGFQIVLAHAAPLRVSQRGKGDRSQRGHGVYFNHSPVGHKENADG